VIITGAGRGAKALQIEQAKLEVFGANSIGRENMPSMFSTKELWSNPDIAPQFASPVLKDGALYCLSDKGTLYCLNARDGKTAWTDTTARGRSGFAALIDAGPVLMALPNNSELVVFKPNAAAFEEIATIRVAATPTYTTPLLAGKRLYIRDQDSLAMFEF
jgi:outer membrane protein assembly factor BamB